MRIAFITNIPAHYRLGLFEALADKNDIDFYFFTDGSEKYRLQETGLAQGRFRGKFLSGFRIPGGIYMTPSLIHAIMSGNYDVVIKCINGKFALPVTFMVAKILGKPFILWTGIWEHPRTMVHQLTFPLAKFIYSHSDAIVIYGTHVKEYLVGLGIDRRKIFIAWNTVDNSAFNITVMDAERNHLRCTLGIKDEKVVLYVGRIEPEKGLEYLLEAFADAARKVNAILVLIGKGSMADEVRKEIKQDFAGRAMLLDFVPNNELYRYYAIADILVLPSVTTAKFKEPWGLVVNEAMNQNCAVVATDAVGAAVGGLVEDGRTGLVVPERDARALGDAITKILLNERLLSEMGSAGADKIRSWDYQRQANGFIEAIRSVTVDE